MKDKAGCKACNMTGYICVKREGGQPMVRPCTCLYEIAKKLTMSEEEPKTFQDIQSRKRAEETVRAYESHKEKSEEENKNGD